MKRILIPCLALVASFGLLAQDDPLAEAVVAGGTSYLEAGGIGCVACHGSYGLGDMGIGPNIRGVNATRIEGALEGAEEMEFLLPLLSNTDIDNLAAYLQYLDTLEPAGTLFRQGVFEPAESTIATDTQVQLILTNGNRSDCTFELEGAETEPVVVAGRSAGDMVLTTPSEPTTLIARCQEEPAATWTLNVAVPSE